MVVGELWHYNETLRAVLCMRALACTRLYAAMKRASIKRCRHKNTGAVCVRFTCGQRAIRNISAYLWVTAGSEEHLGGCLCSGTETHDRRRWAMITLVAVGRENAINACTVGCIVHLSNMNEGLHSATRREVKSISAKVISLRSVIDQLGDDEPFI